MPHSHLTILLFHISYTELQIAPQGRSCWHLQGGAMKCSHCAEHLCGASLWIYNQKTCPPAAQRYTLNCKYWYYEAGGALRWQIISDGPRLIDHTPQIGNNGEATDHQWLAYAPNLCNQSLLHTIICVTIIIKWLQALLATPAEIAISVEADWLPRFSALIIIYSHLEHRQTNLVLALMTKKKSIFLACAVPLP